MTKGQKIALGITVGIPLACGLGGFGIMEGLFGSAAATRDRELAKARAEGIPTTPDELSRMISVPDAENAGPLYEQLQATCADGRPLYKDLTAINQGYSTRSKPADRAAAMAALPAVQPALAIVREAAKLPHCDFHRNWAAGANVLFPEYSTLKNLARALSLEAEQRSSKGDWRGALDDISVVEKVSHHVREDPILIGLLVSVSMEAIADAAFRQVIDEHSHDPAFLAAASQVLDKFGPLGDFRYAIKGEMAMARATLRQIRGLSDLQGSYGGGEPREPSSIERALFQSRTVQNAFDAKLIKAYRQMVEECANSPADWEQNFRAAQASDMRAEADRSISGLANQVMMPVFSAAAEAIGMELAHRNIIDTALRLLTNRELNGKLPRYLPKYGSTGIDPFSDKPLLYRREGKGFIVYSVGRDRTDNGGIDSVEAKGGQYDEIFRVP